MSNQGDEAMSNKNQKMEIKQKIERVKYAIANIGEMRSGSLSVQYKNRKDKSGAFYQLSYTRNGKSRSESIKPIFLDKVQMEIKEYKKYTSLVDELTDLSIELSRLNMKKKTKGAQL